MKHVKYAEKSVLVTDETADTLIEYARVVADEGGAETVTLSAISPDGNTVEASFLLTPSTEIMVESTNSDMAAPENDDEIIRMRERIAGSRRGAVAEDEAPWGSEDADTHPL